MTTPSADESVSPPSYAPIGRVLAGKYRIERVLGRGGMGIVVAASHVKLRQTVAIKFLLPSPSERPDLVSRLLREARAAAALKGEHVARVFDVDLVEGAPYIVMEYLEGRTLAQLLEADGPLSPVLTVDYALEACEALAEAHALGIVHRDLKPSNLFLARGLGGRQTLRVLDFGISKAFDSDAHEVRSGVPWSLGASGDTSTLSATDSHALVGSPPFVSPEQLIRPAEADARSDIWSLGVVLHQCLSGRLPFQGETLTRLWDAILREPPPAFEATGLAVPAELERVVRRCLEKDVARRYASVHELARDLAALGTARARASLEVIEGLAVAAPAARVDGGPSSEKGLARLEMDATLTDAPTTRERTPSESASIASPFWWRSRANLLAVVGAALLVGLFIAARPEGAGESTARRNAAEPLKFRSPEPARPAASVAPPREVTTSPVEVVEAKAPMPLPVRPRAKTPAVHREREVAEAPSAASPSRAEAAPVDVLGRAEELLSRGQISEACAVGQVAAESAPESPRVLEFLGRCYMRLGSVDRARSYYRKYLELNPSAPNAAFVRAMLEPSER